MIQRLLHLAVALLVGAAPTYAAVRGLTLPQARQTALGNHPKISVAELRALAARQVVSQAVAPFLPSISASAGGAVAAEDNTRIVTSTLPVSTVLNRAGASVLVSQLITDFGRTWHLVKSSKLKAGAEQQNVVATKAQIILQVDGAYFAALQARALLQVAESTVKSRQLLRDQIATLAHNQLKSELDVSFAETKFQEAVLLRSKAKNDVESAVATLAALLDEPQVTSYELAEAPSPNSLPGSVTTLVAQALQKRPDLQAVRLESRSAQEFSKAETALSFPTISAQGTAGIFPWRDETLSENYAAAGFVVSVPIFSGGYNTARRREANLRADAAAANLHNEENNVIRDVRLAWLACNNADERVTITANLLEQSRKTLALARARYDVGSSSIVELSQSQLSLTGAEIAHTSARYEYLARRSLLNYQTGILP